MNPIVRDFHQLYYGSDVWFRTNWLGVPAQKNPLDLWIYQEIIYNKRPDLIVECGTADGGSALFLASILDLLGHGKVVTIDVLKKPRPQHPRIHYIHGSSTDPAVITEVEGIATNSQSTMVILDSNHTYPHVLKEIHSYHRLVTLNNYLIVEDTQIGNPVCPGEVPGPAEAVAEFLRTNDQFTVDKSREKFHFTFNPGGYLLRCKVP
jgi:cephalosporin hydroxylase